jgi:Sulfotransferase family
MKVATISSSNSIVMNNKNSNNQCQEEDENQSLLELDSFLESFGQNQQDDKDKDDNDDDDDDDDDESSSVNDDDSDSDSNNNNNNSDDDDLGDNDDDFVGCQNDTNNKDHPNHPFKLQPILDSDIVQGHHMIDVIDPDAVDFAPFLTNPSGTAINYHDESHMLTEHHEKLHRKNNKRDDSSSPLPPSSPPPNHDMTSCYSFFTSYCYYPYISRHSLPYQETNSNTNDDWQQQQQQQYNPEAEKTPLRPRRTKNPITICRRYFCSLFDGDDESGSTKYIILAMFVFILYSTTRHTMKGYFDNSSSSSMSTITQKVPHDESYQNQHTSNRKNNNPWIPPDIQAAYRDVDDLPIAMMDTPIYWHIPRSGGTTMKLIFSMCMGRVVACEQGAGHQLDEQLELLNKPFGNFANVDTSTPLGLHRAAELGLIPSRQVDVILTPHVREATQLFDEHHRGRLFTMFRHPVERVVSLYYFLRMPDQETILGWNVQDMTLEQFATDISENWMVRSLTKTMRGPLTDDHLQIAKEIIRTKFLIGLMEQKTESLRRIQSYFDWKLPSRISQTCKNNMFYFEPQSKNVHDFLDPNSNEYEIVAKRNQFDMDLYEYAVYLFEEQSDLIPMK